MSLHKKYDEYLVANGGMYFPGIIEDESKSDNPLTPIFETITNALEAIKLKDTNRSYSQDDNLTISIHVTDVEGGQKLHHIDIQDTGIGFNPEQFFAFTTYKYNKKGFNNKGCGRFQSLLFFKYCRYISTFCHEGIFYNLDFDFSTENANSKGIKINKFDTTKSINTGTTVSLFPIEGDCTYDALDTSTLKKELIKKYAMEFILHKGHIPSISIREYKNGILTQEELIEYGLDIPEVSHTMNFELCYKKLEFLDGGQIEIVDVIEKESFALSVVPFSSDILNFNEVFVCAKRESIKNIEFNAFAKDDTLNQKRFLCFVSSEVFDKPTNIDNCRREIKNILKTEEQVLKSDTFRQARLFDELFILQEELENMVAKQFYELFPDAKIKENQKREKESFLKDLFGLEENSRLSIKTSDSSRDILEKYYRSEALKQANLDAAFSDTYEKLHNLDTNHEDYLMNFTKLNEELAEKIPLRNKHAISKYMVNRHIVLKLFDLILQKKLLAQSEPERQEEEKRLHNLIFARHSNNPYASNLWLLNEDFIYFDGYSEFRLDGMLDDEGNKLFDLSTLTQQDRDILTDRSRKRPDIILFPKEGKCILIELKAPGVGVSQHVDQTEQYARIISSYSSKRYKINQFYSYLIVDDINIIEIPSEYEEMNNYEKAYFAPSKRIKGVINGERKELGYMYSEILQYSDIYKRANLRHKIFIGHLTNKN